MKILFDPRPRTANEIFSEEDQRNFFAEHEIFEIDPMQADSQYAEWLPQMDVIISQQALDSSRLAAATKLKAIFNVETNFLSNVDYAYCASRSIPVLTPSSVFALAVAEIGLAMALSLARNVHQAHADFQNGLEKYGLEGNQDAELLTGATVGILGYGDLGRAVKGVLQGFQNKILAHDPWLPDGFLERSGVEPVGLERLLRESRFVFVTATITTENSKLLNAERLEWLQPGAMLILLSRAAIADFDDLQTFANSGRIRVATDVFPEEPVPLEDPIRQTKNMLLSAHRAGALTSALQQIGKLVLEDLELISRNLPPASCKRAQLETVTQIRSKPIEKT